MSAALFQLLMACAKRVSPDCWENHNKSIENKIRWAVATERNEFKKKCEFERLDAMMGKRVISFGNETANPVVGFLVRVEVGGQNGSFSIPIIYDVNNNSEWVCFGKVFPFTERRLDYILRLTPDERWDFVMSVSEYPPVEDYNDVCDKDDKISPAEMLIHTLRKRGFYDHQTYETWKEFRDLAMKVGNS